MATEAVKQLEAKMAEGQTPAAEQQKYLEEKKNETAEKLNEKLAETADRQA